jgi:hypothetical protein
MTASGSNGAHFPPSLRGGSASVQPGTAACEPRPTAARVRQGALPSFAAYLDVLGKEARGSRSVGAVNALGSGVSAEPSRAMNAASESTVNAPTGRSEPSTAEDDDGEGFLSASDALDVGREATIDPIVPMLVSLAARGTPVAQEAPLRPDARAPFEQLMARLVRRIAWSGNARSGSARLELGAGELEGATLTIHADDGIVRVAIELPPGVDGAAWKERISGRLGALGLQVETIDVA